VTRWLAAFAFTQAVEVPLYTRATGGRVTVAFGASLLTHPIVFFLFPALWPGSYWGQVAAAEAFAVAVEAAWLGAFGVRHSIWWAVGANLLSAGLGLGSRALFGWP